MAAREAVLLITRNFPPLVGGMEKLNQRLLQGLAERWQTLLCGPAGCRAHAPAGTEVVEAPLAPLRVFLWVAFRAGVALARGRRPRWVIAGSGLTAPLAWLAARLSGARCAVYLHGLDVIAPHRAYQWLWLPFIRRFDLAFANSANTAGLARSRGVPAARLHVVHPGTDRVAGPPPAIAARVQWGVGERPMLLSVGRFTQRKGLAEFVRNALPAIVERVPTVVMVIVGAEAADALHGARPGEQQRIEAAARDAGVQDHVRFAGRCEQSTLESALASADCHVFPVLDLPGDVEGFGMVALEAAGFGLPSVAFRVGGVPDAVEEGRTGRLLAPGDYAGFAQAVCDLLARGRTEQSQADCISFARAKSWGAFSARIDQLLGAAT